MVDTHFITPLSKSTIQQMGTSLHQLADRTLTSQQFVAIAESLYWSLIEGEYRTDDSPQASQLRETLTDITTQWECLLGNWHDASSRTSAEFPEFPTEWVNHWLTQIQQLEATPMAEAPKNQPTFHINQVGNINTGDVTIQGDQVGIQHNYAPQQDLTQAAKDIRDLLQQLDLNYTTTTTTEQTTAIARNVDQQPSVVRTRIVGALEKGGKKALEKLVDHPAAAIAIAVYEGWKEAKK
jgi:hypothetical protein